MFTSSLTLEVYGREVTVSIIHLQTLSSLGATWFAGTLSPILAFFIFEVYGSPTVLLPYSFPSSGCTCTLVNFLDNEGLSSMKWTSSRHINHEHALMDIYLWWGERNLIFDLWSLWSKKKNSTAFATKLRFQDAHLSWSLISVIPAGSSYSRSQWRNDDFWWRRGGRSCQESIQC